MSPWYREPFFQVALPIMITFALAYWHNSKVIDGVSKRIDDLRDAMGKRFDDLGKRIDDLSANINRRFDEVGKRLDRLEDRAGIYKP